jgi:hypothetical protein
MIEMCRAEYDRLIEQSPPVSKSIIVNFNKKFPDTGNLFAKPELTTIHPIETFVDSVPSRPAVLTEGVEVYIEP